MHPNAPLGQADASTRSKDSKRIERRAAIASVIGTTIEWYDFFIYGTAAALVFPKLFFAHGSSEGLMESFATIFVGFLSRPLGGAIFGYMGDRVGRKSTLVATLTLMGVATLFVGLLPTSQQIGPAAGWLLIGLRFLQGIGVGGEWGGAVLLSMESHQGKRRGFMASLPNVGVPLGLVISVLVWSVCSRWSGDSLMEFGWRVPFYASGVLLVFGLLIRMRGVLPWQAKDCRTEVGIRASRRGRSLSSSRCSRRKTDASCGLQDASSAPGQILCIRDPICSFPAIDRSDSTKRALRAQTR